MFDMKKIDSFRKELFVHWNAEEFIFEQLGNSRSMKLIDCIID